MIAWILFALSAIAVLIVYAKQGELRRQLADAEAKIARLDAGASDQKAPVAVAAGVGQVAVAQTEAQGDVEKRLHASHAEVKRLEAAVADAEKRLATERAKSEAAVAKASVAEAMVSQTRSRATEAGHAALMDARKEADDIRALLAEAQARLQAVSDPERRMGELVTAAKRAEAEAVTGAERAKALHTELESLRAKLVSAEASATTANLAVTAASAEAEKTARDQFESQLQEANAEFERNIAFRLAMEQEKHEAEQHRLLLELEKARVALQTQERMPTPPSEPEPTLLPRTRPVVTRGTEIGGAGDEKPLVIVADSDANAVKHIAQHLEAGGYSVRTTNSVAEAILAARSSSPVAFALDSTNLPDGDCWSVLASVKEDPDLREIPVLVFAPYKDKERAMEMGAAGCFPKPIDKAVLVATIKAAMVKRKQRARLAAASGGASMARRTSALTTPS